jgi:hypothetical protein
MGLKKGIKQLLAEAGGKAPAISVEDARKRHGDAGTVFVEIRDVRELEREGMIPGAFHAPRGMLEKTVADCFKFRNKIGLDVALEALREARRVRRGIADDLWRYVGICRVQNVMRPYLESLV